MGGYLENTRIELVYMKLCIFPCLPNRDKFKEKFVIKNKLVKKTLLEINQIGSSKILPFFYIFSHFFIYGQSIMIDTLAFL